MGVWAAPSSSGEKKTCGIRNDIRSSSGGGRKSEGKRRRQSFEKKTSFSPSPWKTEGGEEPLARSYFPTPAATSIRPRPEFRSRVSIGLPLRLRRNSEVEKATAKKRGGGKAKKIQYKTYRLLPREERSFFRRQGQEKEKGGQVKKKPDF